MALAIWALASLTLFKQARASSYCTGRLLHHHRECRSGSTAHGREQQDFRRFARSVRQARQGSMVCAVSLRRMPRRCVELAKGVLHRLWQGSSVDALPRFSSGFLRFQRSLSGRSLGLSWFWVWVRNHAEWRSQNRRINRGYCERVRNFALRLAVPNLDSKSAAGRPTWGFNSPFQHQPYSFVISEIQAANLVCA